jgi:hypothetical protein
METRLSNAEKINFAAKPLRREPAADLKGNVGARRRAPTTDDASGAEDASGGIRAQNRNLTLETLAVM